ncbi:MAG: phytoene desaturase family protein [Bacteroidota bacterium]
METNKYDTIIVGGGIAGLTAAAYLARAGRKILLIEKNSEFGGLVSSIRMDGFLFEAGVRALESAGVILPMLEDLDIKLDVVRSKVSVGIEDRIIHIEDESSIAEYRELLLAFYPDNEKEIDHFIRTMRKIMKHLDVLYGIENPAFKDLKNDRAFLFKKLLPWLPRFLFTIGKINRLNVPVEPYLETIISSHSLRDMISQHFFKGTPAFFALSYFSLYLDYFYPVGGVGKLAEAVKDKVLEFNGELLPDTTITRVNAAQKFLTDSNENNYAYEQLIWAADLKSLYRITETGELKGSTKTRYDNTRSRIMESRGCESVFSLYLEVDLPLSYFTGISHGHFFYTPSRKGLKDIHRGELGELLKEWNTKDKKEILSWLDRFLEFNTFEISVPGLKDSSLVPENKTGLIISIIVEYALFKKVEEAGWHEEFRKEIEKRMIAILSASVYPQLKDRILKQFSFTPLSIRNRIGSTDGAIVGWSLDGPVPVVDNIISVARSVNTAIPGILQAGQWAYSPAGVPMSILTGKLAADRALKG